MKHCVFIQNKGSDEKYQKFSFTNSNKSSDNLLWDVGCHGDTSEHNQGTEKDILIWKDIHCL